MAKIYPNATKQKARNLRNQDRVKLTQKKDYRGICRIVYPDVQKPRFRPRMKSGFRPKGATPGFSPGGSIIILLFNLNYKRLAKR